MKESLYKLLDLQEIDKEINALIQSQEDYPGEISSLKHELKIAQTQLDERQDRSEELEKNQRSLERELESITADLKKWKIRYLHSQLLLKYFSLTKIKMTLKLKFITAVLFFPQNP